MFRELQLILDSINLYHRYLLIKPHTLIAPRTPFSYRVGIMFNFNPILHKKYPQLHQSITITILLISSIKKINLSTLLACQFGICLISSDKNLRFSELIFILSKSIKAICLKLTIFGPLNQHSLIFIKLKHRSPSHYYK